MYIIHLWSFIILSDVRYNTLQLQNLQSGVKTPLDHLQQQSVICLSTASEGFCYAALSYTKVGVYEMYTHLSSFFYLQLTSTKSMTCYSPATPNTQPSYMKPQSRRPMDSSSAATAKSESCLPTKTNFKHSIYRMVAPSFQSSFNTSRQIKKVSHFFPLLLLSFEGCTIIWVSDDVVCRPRDLGVCQAISRKVPSAPYSAWSLSLLLIGQ